MLGHAFASKINVVNELILNPTVDRGVDVGAVYI